MKHARGRSRWRAAAGVLVCACLGLSPHAQKGRGGAVGSARSVNGIYRGTIGDQEVVVELGGPLDGEHAENYAHAGDEQTYPIRGSYFYRRHGVSIELVGMPLGNGVVRLREYKHVVRDDEFTAEWRLTMQEDKATGTFCKCDLSQEPASHPSASGTPALHPATPTPGASGTPALHPATPTPGASGTPARLKISLTRVSERLTPDSGWQNYKPNSGNTYYDLLLDFPLQEGREIQVSPEVVYRMRTDPRFKVSRPRLVRFPNAAVMARINRDLDADLTDSRLYASSVLSGGEFGGRFGGIYDESVSGHFLLPHVLSFSVNTEWYSGGAHPNQGGYSLNYDLRTGKRFELEEAFRTSPGNKDSSGPILAKLYLRHYLKPMEKDAPPDTDCGKVVREELSRGDFRPLLSLNQDGLAIEPPLPHVLIACGPSVTVPFGKLRPYVRKESPLGLLVEERSEKK